jgi:hypothetical protein
VPSLSHARYPVYRQAAISAGSAGWACPPPVVRRVGDAAAPGRCPRCQLVRLDRTGRLRTYPCHSHDVLLPGGSRMPPPICAAPGWANGLPEWAGSAEADAASRSSPRRPSRSRVQRGDAGQVAEAGPGIAGQQEAAGLSGVGGDDQVARAAGAARSADVGRPGWPLSWTTSSPALSPGRRRGHRSVADSHAGRALAADLHAAPGARCPAELMLDR